MSKIDFVRMNKKLKKRVKILKRKLKKWEDTKNTKEDKDYTPALTRKVDCSDMFKMKDTTLSVQYCYNRESGRDLFFDIRMFSSIKEIKTKRFDTVLISVNGGKIGIKKMIKFITKNEDKFIKIRKGVIRMTKKRSK